MRRDVACGSPAREAARRAMSAALAGTLALGLAPSAPALAQEGGASALEASAQARAANTSWTVPSTWQTEYLEKDVKESDIVSLNGELTNTMVYNGAAPVVGAKVKAIEGTNVQNSYDLVIVSPRNSSVSGTVSAADLQAVLKFDYVDCILPDGEVAFEGSVVQSGTIYGAASTGNVGKYLAYTASIMQKSISDEMTNLPAGDVYYTITKAKASDVDLPAVEQVSLYGEAPRPSVEEATIDGNDIEGTGAATSYVYYDAAGQVVDASEVTSRPGTYSVRALLAGGDNVEAGLTAERHFTVGAEADKDAFESATVAEAVDETGEKVALPEDGAYQFAADGEAHWLVPTKLELADGTLLDVTGPDYEVSAGPVKAVSDGSRTAAVTAVSGPFDGASNATLSYEVAASASLADAGVRQAAGLVWSGEELTPSFETADGEPLEASGNNPDYTVEGWYDATGKKRVEDIIDAGTYVAKLTGTGEWKAETVEVPVTVSKLDLSSATASDLQWSGEVLTPEVSAGGTAVFGGEDDARLVDVELTSGQAVVRDKGSYTAKVTPADGQSSNMEGSAEVSFKVVDQVADEFAYGGASYASGTKETFYSAKGESFSPDAFRATDVPNGTWTVKVYDAAGEEVDGWSARGSYTAVLTVDAEVDGETLGGTCTMPFEVVSGDLADADVEVKVDGKAVSGTDLGTLSYTGSDLSSRVSVTVKDGAAVLEEGSDYELLWAKGGEEASEVVSSGSWELEVRGLAWSGSERYSLEVAKGQAKALKAAGRVVAAEGALPEVMWSATGAGSWAALDEGSWEAEGLQRSVGGEWVDVDSADVRGTYRVLVGLSEDADVELAEGASAWVEFEAVPTGSGFSDVPDSAWYASAVSQAAALGYMSGDSNGVTFRPEAGISRAEVACVLGNMAGVSPEGWAPVYPDVAQGAWYAANVCWAREAGVMGGYQDGRFGPEDAMTREQFACALYNYANAFSGGASAKDADGTLAKMPDGGQVSDWAREAVAWAVEEGVMGNGGFLNPQGNVTRAEAAAMAVNFQPSPLL